MSPTGQRGIIYVPEKWIAFSKLYRLNKNKDKTVKTINIRPNKPVTLKFWIVHKFKASKRSLRILKISNLNLFL